jgi:hypothetical protein
MDALIPQVSSKKSKQTGRRGLLIHQGTRNGCLVAHLSEIICPIMASSRANIASSVALFNAARLGVGYP